MEYLRIGLDAGSTTVKTVVLGEKDEILFSRYVRHGYHVRETVIAVLSEICRLFPDANVSISVTGMGVLESAEGWRIPFIQELSAEALALKRLCGRVDVAIELGGEDAKVTYFRKDAAPDQRMNRNCAGGTGAFLDHLAAFLGTDAAGLDRLAAKGQRMYPIAARCGVFAKTDVQGLLNEGAAKEDIALSVFQAIVNQVLSGLARGCPIRGRVAFLGGPLTYMPALRARFIETLHLSSDHVVHPSNGELFGALGAALSAEKEGKPVRDILCQVTGKEELADTSLIKDPLFSSEEEYEVFRARHGKAKVLRRLMEGYNGPLWLGIDAGSTTLKAVLIDGDGAVRVEWYENHGGNVLAAGKILISKVYASVPEGAYIAGSGITGYGEELLKAAFHIDRGEVETMAHLRAARFFCPDLTALLDIGGQDMKYIRLEDGVISRISLNSACASGCGSFLETFAETLHRNVKEFAQMAVHAPHLLDLGYRCTVLMNSRVRQVQRNPIDTGALAAGLCMAVVKNALYRVIRLTDASEMGDRIVVEGGTFYNDAVLRSLESILGHPVIRPDMAGLMGAYGMALLAKEEMDASHRTALIPAEEAAALTVTERIQRCGGCGNRCLVTAHQFPDGSAFITGNRCERGELLMRGRAAMSGIPAAANLYGWMRDHVFENPPLERKPLGVVGIPSVLSMWEDFPYWTTFFRTLGYRVIRSDFDARGLGETAETVPDGIFCHACRLAHVHLWDLLRKKPDFIWMPVMPRGKEEPEIDEERHASYGDRLAEAMGEAISDAGISFLHPHVPSLSSTNMADCLSRVFPQFAREKIEEAVQAAEAAEIGYYTRLRMETERLLEEIRRTGKTAVILCGRDYHTDPQVNQGIPHLFTSLGVPVLSGEGALLLGKEGRDLLAAGDWTLRERLLASAALTEKEENLHFVQLHSISCGYDGLTNQEVEKHLAKAEKLYTVLSLDQGMNTGALRIRIRSLLAEIKELAAHPEARERLKIREEDTEIKADILYLASVHPLYDPLLAAAFKAEGRHVEILTPGDREDGAVLPEEAGYAATAALAACRKSLRNGNFQAKHSALLVLSSGKDAGAVRPFLQGMGGEAVYFDCGRRGGHFPITLDLLHRFFCAIFLGDFLLRLSLACPYSGSIQNMIREVMPLCAEAVKAGTFQAYEEGLQAVQKICSKCKPQSGEKPVIGIEGDPFLMLPTMGSLRKHVEQDGGCIACMGLGEWYANEISEVYWSTTFGGNRKEAEVCLSARNMAGVYLDAFGEAVSKISWLDSVDKDKEKREFLYPRIEQRGKHLPEQERDLLRRKVQGILHVTGLADFEINTKRVYADIQKIYPGFPYLSMEYFEGENRLHGENRLKLLMERCASAGRNQS